MVTKGLAAVLRFVGFWIAFLLIIISAVYWVINTPGTIAASLANSQPADKQAVIVEKLVLAHVPKSRHVTILYLDPGDMGDNFYRLRYALYPIQFVPYWSWTVPNQGGHVWNLPIFNTVHGLRSIMLNDHVNYVVAVRGPKLLQFLHKPYARAYLFQVNQQRLKSGTDLAAALTEVTKWS